MPISYTFGITPLAAITLVVGIVAVAAAGWRWRAHREEARQWRAAWGRPRTRERPMALIAEYHRVQRAARGSAGSLDDRTCDDLHLDAVFARLDRTESAVGQQLLYHRLRTAPVADAPDAFEALVTRIGADATLRDRLQKPLAALRDPAAYQVCAIAESAPATRPWHAVFPVLAVVMAVAITSAPFWPVALLVAIVGIVVHFHVRMAIARPMGSLLALFGQVAPLFRAADAVSALRGPDTEALLGGLDATPRLRRLRQFAGWAGSRPTGNELADTLVQYGNLVFLLDANAFYFGVRELRRHADALVGVVAAVGTVDAALAVASYRAGTTGWVRPRLAAPGSPVKLEGLRHPLLEDAVANDVVLGPPAGLLLTGANMSGKSTLLRTIGIDVVLAQTINTCLATAYDAPVLRVRSLLGRADDLIAGKSYYLVEIEGVLEVLAAARTDVPHLLLFDELLRGTNTVERIAAGAAVLSALVEPGPGAGRHVVVAATHDRELVDLLDGRYAPAHLSDAIGPDGIAFDYRLRPGPATSRNAIALLELTGAPSSLVEEARTLASRLNADIRRGGRAETPRQDSGSVVPRSRSD